ncbi:ATP-dependent metalloprotease FtsH [Desulfocapsa sulfexigens DSM 10523]|uniref:ATP-dependent zinc metalloprotease FtsH n=1 Tax=Desulfocapsa sulfexigens (strain DSM 10523 / SB164P1) TaxID=1167006 RepID=M1PTA5_DESSD|nr:ATP-dependent zinc metalloprotease FtsH [Desulfocapsa sulfexigens]AGF79556.1 ATP-dependent metalloprotease FtsH [Desulfocapsa sulfexigens DSM 10523]
MAILIRNLFVFFLFTVILGGSYGLWILEHQLRTVSYSEFRYCLANHDLKSTTFTGNKVIATHKSGDSYETTVPNAEKLISELQDKNIQIIFKKDRSEQIFQAIAIIYVILLLLTVIISLSRKKKTEEEENKFASDKLILPDGSHKQVTFDDVAGIPEALEELQEVVNFLKDPEQYSQIGAVSPKGVLLQGPPGTGKTLLARAIAGEAKVPFYSFSGSDFVEMFVGVGASRVRDIFKEAKSNAPCIIFIDEIDAVGGSRAGGSTASGQDERSQTLNALLVEMDGFSSTDTIIVLAATNRPDILDPALRRPGRFDRQVNILPPDIKGRKRILKVHSAKVALAPEINLDKIAHMVPGFTGAELANLVNEAALMAAREQKKVVSHQHFEQARDRILMGVERKGRIMSDADREILAYHEAGHAIVAKTLPDADPIHKITIIPRGQALGQTQQLSINDRSSYNFNYLRSRIVILMGGRAAEEIAFGQRTTGAQGDIVQATEIATNMICKWGMSDVIGPQAMVIDNAGFLGGSSHRVEMSDRTSEAIDKEIKNLLASCHDEAVVIIKEQYYLLKQLAAILLEVETLDDEEFNIIMSCQFKEKIAAGIKETHECETCPAADRCIHSKLKKD